MDGATLDDGIKPNGFNRVAVIIAGHNAGNNIAVFAVAFIA
jgi:hypothetical protein